MILEEKELKINNPLTVLAAALDYNSIECVDTDGTARFCIGNIGEHIIEDTLGLTGYAFDIIIDTYFPVWDKIFVYNCDEDSEEEPKKIPIAIQLTDSNRALYQILLDRLVSLATQEFFDCGYLWQK